MRDTMPFGIKMGFKTYKTSHFYHFLFSRFIFF